MPAYFKLYPEDISWEPNGRVIKFEIRLNERSKQHLNFILDMMSIDDWGDQPPSRSGRPFKPRFHIDNGMFQYKKNLLKNKEGQVIEARYRFYGDENGEIKIDKVLDAQRKKGSYLKIGDNDSFVNQGSHFIAWDKMHDYLVDQYDPSGDKDGYASYMEALVKSQALHYIQGLRNLGYKVLKPGFTGQIDIAWHASDREVITTPDSKQISVPRPILMEAFISKFKLEEKSKPHFRFSLNDCK